MSGRSVIEARFGLKVVTDDGDLSNRLVISHQTGTVNDNVKWYVSLEGL